MIALISLAANHLPGQACRPNPKDILEELLAAYCARAATSGAPFCLIFSKRKPSNFSGSGYSSGSMFSAAVGMPIVVWAGITNPSDSLKSSWMTRSKVTVNVSKDQVRLSYETYSEATGCDVGFPS